MGIIRYCKAALARQNVRVRLSTRMQEGPGPRSMTTQSQGKVDAPSRLARKLNTFDAVVIGLKHRGVTDTEGNIGDKQDAAGHVERKMTQRYAHDLPVVAPPTKPKSSS